MLDTNLFYKNYFGQNVLNYVIMSESVLFSK